MQTPRKQLFIEKLTKIYPDFDLTTIATPRKVSFRINTIKSRKEDIQTFLNSINAVQGPFENTFVIDIANKSVLSQSFYFNEGLIYIQGLASMLPPMVLDIKPTDNVLDICSAPGSKTSLVASLVNNQPAITAVDNNIKRLNAMKQNLETLGVENVTYIRSDATKLPFNPVLINSFDKIICDVPCSNEGQMRDLDNYDFSKWNPKISQHLPVLQKKIVASALKLLKSGGTLAYSTCTYSPEENERVIDWCLSHNSDIELIDIRLPKTLQNFVTGFKNWNKKLFNETLSKTVRVLPSDTFDGFYLALLRKK